ncbi:hypothetical protein Pmani_016743 [Petrolisthes manimaculis]|uniref:Uncharacterized protein n=1 Tax=Petrolisthes manimaculis TaxID=1843537 RepID=A0AAE1PR31_9EUCA|nr:hypothetical protein Pmani_016743 [Petrolisthes manimaculis]
MKRSNSVTVLLVVVLLLFLSPTAVLAISDSINTTSNDRHTAATDIYSTTITTSASTFTTTTINTTTTNTTDNNNRNNTSSTTTTNTTAPTNNTTAPTNTTTNTTPPTTTSSSTCLDRHSCKVDILPNTQVGFLNPSLCCPEEEGIEFPYTFLANFTADVENIRELFIHPHEFYLEGVEIYVCDETFFDVYDTSWESSRDYCRVGHPTQCGDYKGPPDVNTTYLFKHTIPIKGDVYLNITIPGPPKLLTLPHEPYRGRPLFNITYEQFLGEADEFYPIMEVTNITYLQQCHYNGIPTLQLNDEGYERGATVCDCQRDYFGDFCQHHWESAPLLSSQECREWTNCSDLCVIMRGQPRCICPESKTLINETQCIGDGNQVWDLTVTHQNISQVRLQHKKHKGPLLDPMGVYVENCNLVLTCTILGDYPLQVTWYKESQPVYFLNVPTCDEKEVKIGKLSSRLVRTDRRRCMAVLEVAGNDPVLDSGNYTCSVANRHFATSRSVIASFPPPLWAEILPHPDTFLQNKSVSLTCRIGNTWSSTKQYDITWNIEPTIDDSHFTQHRTSWNTSVLTILHLQKKHSTVVCRAEQVDVCGGEKMSVEERVELYVVQQDQPRCPQQLATDSNTWHTTLPGKIALGSCPEGHVGRAQRKCHLNNTWGDPDYSNCTYHPLHVALMKEELRLQKRGYPIYFQRSSELVTEICQLLKSRASYFLPGEHHSLLKSLHWLLFDAETTPVSFGVFLEAVQAIIDKFNPLYATELWEVQELIRQYLRVSLNNNNNNTQLERSDSLTARLGSLGTHGGVFTLETTNLDTSSTKLKVEVSVNKSSSTSVGAIIYINTTRLLAAVDTQRNNCSDTCVRKVRITEPMVDVMARTDTNRRSHQSLPLVTRLTYTRVPTYKDDLQDMNGKQYVWVSVCGKAQLDNRVLEWDLDSCGSKPLQGDEGSVQCQCQGQGLFGLVHILEPKIPWHKSSLRGLVAICSVVTLVVLLLLALLIYRSPPSWLPSMRGFFKMRTTDVLFRKITNDRESHRGSLSYSEGDRNRPFLQMYSRSDMLHEQISMKNFPEDYQYREEEEAASITTYIQIIPQGGTNSYLLHPDTTDSSVLPLQESSLLPHLPHSNIPDSGILPCLPSSNISNFVHPRLSHSDTPDFSDIPCLPRPHPNTQDCSVLQCLPHSNIPNSHILPHLGPGSNRYLDMTPTLRPNVTMINNTRCYYNWPGNNCGGVPAVNNNRWPPVEREGSDAVVAASSNGTGMSEGAVGLSTPDYYIQPDVTFRVANRDFSQQQKQLKRQEVRHNTKFSQQQQKQLKQQQVRHNGMTNRNLLQQQKQQVSHNSEEGYLPMRVTAMPVVVEGKWKFVAKEDEKVNKDTSESEGYETLSAYTITCRYCLSPTSH